ncbi:unnamed protein product [Orchesella dallaii]|uniref:Beta/gamma crystallin 'Greek key' domain-containing protein n=1 Tax=Orchesella dallaii TaxID=48710 RepID=A0ABP1RET3_9HEXA
MSASTFPILITSLILGFAFHATAQRLQYIRFYTSVDCKPPSQATLPPYHNYTESGNITTDVANPGFQSYCVVRGAWRVEHSWPQQETDINISVGDGCATCYRARTTLRFGVIRYLGGKDLTAPYFTLYPDSNFGGREVPIVGNAFSFNQTYSFMSYAFNSYSNWTWQTYQQPNYRGNSICIRPNAVTEVTLVNITSLNVGSIRLGCRNSANSPRSKNVWLILAISSAVIIPIAGIIL